MLCTTHPTRAKKSEPLPIYRRQEGEPCNYIKKMLYEHSLSSQTGVAQNEKHIYCLYFILQIKPFFLKLPTEIMYFFHSNIAARQSVSQSVKLICLYYEKKSFK